MSIFDDILEHCSAILGHSSEIGDLACKLHEISAEDNFNLIKENNALQYQLHEVRTLVESLNREHVTD